MFIGGRGGAIAQWRPPRAHRWYARCAEGTAARFVFPFCLRLFYCTFVRFSLRGIHASGCLYFFLFFFLGVESLIVSLVSFFGNAARLYSACLRIDRGGLILELSATRARSTIQKPALVSRSSPCTCDCRLLCSRVTVCGPIGQNTTRVQKLELT